MGPVPSVWEGEVEWESLLKICPRTSIQNARVHLMHTLGLYSSNSKLSLLKLILSCCCSHWERGDWECLEISKNSYYSSEQFCYMKLYLASGLPKQFEGISEH